MVKLLTLLTSLLLITSCASRKVSIVKEDTKITTDSTSIVKTDSVSTIQNNIVVTENTLELEISPLCDTIPMVVNGITYKGAILRYKKANKTSVDKSTNITNKSSVKKLNVKREDSKKQFSKKVDRKPNYWLILIIPIGIYIYRQIKNKLWL